MKHDGLLFVTIDEEAGKLPQWINKLMVLWWYCESMIRIVNFLASTQCMGEGGSTIVLWVLGST